MLSLACSPWLSHLLFSHIPGPSSGIDSTQCTEASYINWQLRKCPTDSSADQSNGEIHLRCPLPRCIKLIIEANYGRNKNLIDMHGVVASNMACNNSHLSKSSPVCFSAWEPVLVLVNPCQKSWDSVSRWHRDWIQYWSNCFCVSDMYSLVFLSSLLSPLCVCYFHLSYQENQSKVPCGRGPSVWEECACN